MSGYPKCPECGSNRVSVEGRSTATQSFSGSGMVLIHDDSEFGPDMYICRSCGHRDDSFDTPKATARRWLYDEYWRYVAD